MLLRARAECLSREEARLALGAGGDEPLVLALPSGDPGRQEELCRLLRKVCARVAPAARLAVISAELPACDEPGRRVAALYPAVRHLAAADVLVCAGGYHAVHEARLHGLVAIHLPQRRVYDDQHRRVAGSARRRGAGPARGARRARAGSARGASASARGAAASGRRGRRLGPGGARRRPTRRARLTVEEAARAQRLGEERVLVQEEIAARAGGERSPAANARRRRAYGSPSKMAAVEAALDSPSAGIRPFVMQQG